MKAAEIFIAGVVTIGVITALFMPGRTTAQGVTAAGNASSKLLGTAIKGK
jgi:hypothetical protein